MDTTPFYILARTEIEAAIESLKRFSGIHTSTYKSLDEAKDNALESISKFYDIAYKSKNTSEASRDTAALILESYYKDSIFESFVYYSNGLYSIKALKVFYFKPYLETTFEPFHPTINSVLRAKGLWGTKN
jgi:hypothetical protein